ncbi:DUF6602 domain-containing protein [Pseudomonas coronafaciens]|uniref:DUF6602 domain-containing protein n=1 Tax=Pseudomonas coronafaciens pv. coronafaciens TaxID=235275 RepID=A0AAE6QLQ3_9PSED|nr:DUF6602 domain-containing protein [Pseudomonas coronafaciens]QGT84795.1 hypothetical protein GMO17_27035 [Pseudomonas coronafaciens pv. coronafaciens]QIQ74823.1 hypothetical protein HBB04_05246 [Pseudomonas coronafaciens]RMM86165.1 hypothetical protein ALQ71_200101 [Pseudomonas coronafaciens pv. striafaciens]
MDDSFNVSQFLGYLAQDLVDSFARAGNATTPGLVGGAREHSVRMKLQTLLPAAASVATGCVIDSFGGTSNQADVVIHERDNCPVFSFGGSPEATYIPCEGVIAVGEIKSTLGTKELRDSVLKIRRGKTLQRASKDATHFRHFGSAMVMQGADSEAFDPERNRYDQPFCFVLCQSYGVSRATLGKNYAAMCAEAAPHLSPNVVVSLTEGIMLFADAKGALLRNAVGASQVAFFNHPGGDFQFLLNELVNACHRGRTTAVLPYSTYILGEQLNAFAHPKYVQI